MDCVEARRERTRRGGPSPAAAEHLATCEACQLAAIEERLTADLAAEHGVVAEVRALSRLARVGLFGLIVGVTVVLVGALRPRADLDVVPAWRLWAIIGAYVALALLAAWHALRPLWLPRVSPWLTRGLVLLALAAPFALALLPELPTVGEPRLGSCLMNGTLLGVSVLLLARGLDRGGHRGTDEALLAAAGAGLSAVTALHVECHVNFTRHLLLAHAPVPLMLLAAYWLLRRT
jgi:hypothetical protein